MTQHDGKKTAVAYTRVSTEEQVDGLSLESQETKIREWCESKDYEIVAWFSDEGESAFNDEISKRPQFAKMIERLPVLRPTIVIVSSMDRWARSSVVSSQTFRLLHQSGIGFAAADQAMFDFSNPGSRLVMGILAQFAEFSSATTAQHIKRVLDLKFEKGIHRGSIPFGYVAEPASTRADPRPPIPDNLEFPVVQELFRRMLSGRETYKSVATWLNGLGFTTRNRLKSASDSEAGESAKPRRFTEESIRSIAKNPFYAGFVVKEARRKNGTAGQEVKLGPGLHVPAVMPEDFNRVQSIIRAHYRAPRSASPKFRPYLAKGLIRCIDCGEKAWCHHINGNSYYQESSPSRGLACQAPGRYWPTALIDRQIEQMVRPVALPADWQERAVELANAENNVLDLRAERLSLERRRRKAIESYMEELIEREERDRRLAAIENRLRTISPFDVQFVEITVADFENIQKFWDPALPEERANLLRNLAERLYVDFDTGQVLEIVPKDGFRYVLEAAQITRPLSGPELTNGDPEGIRTPDLHRDRVACLTATPRGRVPNRF